MERMATKRGGSCTIFQKMICGCLGGCLMGAQPLSAVLKQRMDFQLVLQFSGDSLADYDAMVALENELIAELGDTADVDGHDFGSGEVNIFIITTDPARTFRQSRAVLEGDRRLG